MGHRIYTAEYPQRYPPGCSLWHYHPTTSKGEPARTIDQIHLEWYFSDGVVLDFSDRQDGYLVTSAPDTVAGDNSRC